MRTWIFIGAALLTGCATDAQRAEHSQMVAEFERTKPRCYTEKSCERMWSAAQSWVVSNCGMKVQNATEGYIETFGSVDTRLACRVVRTPIANDGYELNITTGCGNLFGCFPASWPAALDFNRTVNAQVPVAGEQP